MYHYRLMNDLGQCLVEGRRSADWLWHAGSMILAGSDHMRWELQVEPSE